MMIGTGRMTATARAGLLEVIFALASILGG
jgi:hypothetical protein